MTDPEEIKTGDTIVKPDGEDTRSKPSEFRYYDHRVYTAVESYVETLAGNFMIEVAGEFNPEASKQRELEFVKRQVARQEAKGRPHFCRMPVIPDTPPPNRQQRRALERRMAKFTARKNGPCHPERQIKANGAKWRRIAKALVKAQSA